MNRLVLNFLHSISMKEDSILLGTLASSAVTACCGLIGYIYAGSSKASVALWGLGLVTSSKTMHFASLSGGRKITYLTALKIQAVITAFYACKAIYDIKDLPDFSKLALDISNLSFLTLGLANSATHHFAPHIQNLLNQEQNPLELNERPPLSRTPILTPKALFKARFRTP